MIAFSHPWVLWALPLALLPLVLRPRDAVADTWVSFAPRDAASRVVGALVRIAASLAVAALVVAVADPHRPEYTVERVGKGAEIVLLLDRSRSMDQGFAGAPQQAPSGRGPEVIDFYMRQNWSRMREPKGKVARQLLGEFTARRPDDRFALVIFSALPMRVLDFTSKPEVIQAAITAGNIGRGLSETNIGLALEEALSLFEDRPYTGSRIVMLISDGGDRIEPFTRERLAAAARKHRVAIYWLYLRSGNSPTLADEEGRSPEAVEGVPELALHAFFSSLSTPYRAYEASNSQALQQAIDDVNRLENLPMTYEDVVPQRDLSPWCHAAALACVLVLLGANLMEIRRWA